MINNNISDEDLAAFLDDNIDPIKSLIIEDCLLRDERINEICSIHKDIITLGNDINTMDFGLSNLQDFFLNNNLMEINMTNPIYESETFIGDPNLPTDVQQQYSDTCAIKSQQIILNEFGVEVTEDQLVQYSYEHGWYHGDGSGTSMVDVGNLLEDAGIPCTRQANANVFNLVNELSQGHKVIVGVDSGELWGNKFYGWLKDFYVGETPDHALIVTGIDTSDPNNIKVIVTDPGNGDVAKSYPLDQFMDAWSDAQCYMVSTDIPVPDVVPGMENFDYENGHIAEVAGMDYADFQIFNDISYGVPVSQVDSYGNPTSPISSLLTAFNDVVNNGNIANIFTGYDFNDYLDIDVTTNMMHDTFCENLDNIDFDSLNQPVGPVSNSEYAQFLHDSIDYCQSIGDYTSAEYLSQQMTIINYCDAYNLDFYNNFLI